MYFIGHIIKGKAKIFQEKLIDEVSKEFRLRNNNLRIMPHLTIKAPFECENIKDIEDILEKLVYYFKSSSYKISGVSHFNKRVIFLDVLENEKMIDYTKKIRNELRKMSIDFSYNEEKKKIKFHATICYINRFNFKEILEFLKKRCNKEFNQEFNNIAILEKRDKKWEIYRMFYF